MVASKKLWPYFHIYWIEVLTNYLLRQVLQKPEASWRIIKWPIKLGQFDVNFHPRTTIKGQALANFIAKFTYADIAEVIGTTKEAKVTKVVEERGRENSKPRERDTQQWTLYVDGASNVIGSRAEMMLIGPEGHKIH